MLHTTHYTLHATRLPVGNSCIPMYVAEKTVTPAHEILKECCDANIFVSVFPYLVLCCVQQHNKLPVEEIGLECKTAC